MSQDFDVVVIGAGPGGYVAAIHGAQLGLKVGLVERDSRLGGTCLLRGCIPTKALLESASLFERIQHAGRFGIKVGKPEVEFGKVQAYKERVVTSNARGVTYLMKKYGVTVLEGHGAVPARGQVSVRGEGGETKTVEARHVVLATGSRCMDLPFIEMDHERIINSDDILALKSIPKRLIVMGAGAVGSEFASIFARFGAKVHLIERMDHVLPLEDHDISDAVAKSFKRQGIEVLTGTNVTKVERDGDAVRVAIERGDGGRDVLVADLLLVAVGRAPVTDGLGLDALGVQRDERGYVEVDGLCATAVEGVHAIGDIIRTPAYAHTASHEGTLVMDRIAGRQVHPFNYDHTPNCTFTSPEVGSIGLTERAARERGHDVKIGVFPFAANGKAKIAQETEGLVKIVAEKRYDEVLGIHICGHHATDLIAEGSVALHLETTTEELVHAIHPHPTLSEVIGEAAHAAFFGDPLHF